MSNASLLWLRSAILKDFDALVPCAYITMGRAPVHGPALPEGTITAPDAVVASPCPPTVWYSICQTDTVQLGEKASVSSSLPSGSLVSCDNRSDVEKVPASVG